MQDVKQHKSVVLAVGLVMVLLVAAVPEAGAAPTSRVPPAGRIYHFMVHDPGSSGVFLFGGFAKHGMNESIQSDIWGYEIFTNEWDPVATLEAGIFGAAAGDPKSRRMIVLTMTGETWAYQFGTRSWEKKEPMRTPTSKWGHQLVHDAESDRVLLFGGADGTDAAAPILDETWAYDYSADTWTQMEPEVSPPPRAFHAMAYDAESDRVIAWGGRQYPETYDVSVWAYDYNTDTWTALESSPGPPREYAYPAMVYHPLTDRMILFGGLELSTWFSGRLSDETWSYDYNTRTWTRLEPAVHPEKRSHHAMVYNPVADKIVLFGGELSSAYSDEVSEETWIFDPVAGEWSEAVAGGVSFHPAVASAAIRPGLARTGEPAPVEIDVVLHTPLEMGERLILDLAGLDISASLPLEHRGAGRYTASAPITPSRSGRHAVPVAVETGSGAQHRWASIALEVYPDRDLPLYEDGLGAGWTLLQLVGKVESDLTASTFVHQGRSAHALSLYPAGSVSYVCSEPGGMDPFGYSHLQFYIHGGETGGQNPTIAGQPLSELGVGPQAETWTSVSIPLSMVPLERGRLRGIVIEGKLIKEPFYLDEMKLLAMEPPEVTAVEVAEEKNLPSGCVLFQNYPNPFNGSTMIRFALPTASSMDLAIHNLAGQQLVKLVDGVREVGTHFISWNGRDEDGRELASGVYLCRLRAGRSMEETRMLVLVR